MSSIQAASSDVFKIILKSCNAQSVFKLAMTSQAMLAAICSALDCTVNSGSSNDLVMSFRFLANKLRCTRCHNIGGIIITDKTTDIYGRFNGVNSISCNMTTDESNELIDGLCARCRCWKCHQNRAPYYFRIPLESERHRNISKRNYANTFDVKNNAHKLIEVVKSRLCAGFSDFRQYHAIHDYGIVPFISYQFNHTYNYEFYRDGRHFRLYSEDGDEWHTDSRPDGTLCNQCIRESDSIIKGIAFGNDHLFVRSIISDFKKIKAEYDYIAELKAGATYK